MNKKKPKIPLIYVVLLTLGIPINCVAFIAGLLVLAGAGLPDSWAAAAKICVGADVIYWLVLTPIGFVDVISSLRAYWDRDASACVSGMLTHKYGQIIYFVLNFLIYMLLGFLMLAGSRGTIIFAFPIVLPLIAAAVFGTWTAMFPGAFWGLQVVRLAHDEQKLETGAAILHAILQFVFILDVFDAAYLARQQKGNGKV